MPRRTQTSILGHVSVRFNILKTDDAKTTALSSRKEGRCKNGKKIKEFININNVDS
jgi:hypothetical protein